jgi:hypothetical protein
VLLRRERESGGVAHVERLELVVGVSDPPGHRFHFLSAAIAALAVVATQAGVRHRPGACS